MHVIFINPSSPINDKLTIRHPPLGIGYMSTQLKKYGHQVTLIDMPMLDNPEKELHQQLSKVTTKAIVGITCVSQTYAISLLIAKNIKKLYSNFKIVLGGPHVTFTAHETLERHNYIDYVIRFEAEYAICKLVEVMSASPFNIRKIAEVENLVFRVNDKIIINELGNCIMNLDSVGYPDRDIFDTQKYLRNDYETVMMTARGCVNNCSFCSTTKMGRLYRCHSVKHVIEEIKKCCDLGFKSFFIADDTFPADKDRTIKICEAILSKNIKVNWTCNMRVKDVDVKLLSKMKEAGMYRAFVGFETFDNVALKHMKKGSNIEMAIKASEVFNQLGVELHASMIVGCANQNKRKILNNVEFLKNTIKPTIATFNTIELRPGTDIYKKPEEYGYWMDNPYWYEDPYCTEQIHVRTKYLKEKEIREICYECYSIFYG